MKKLIAVLAVTFVGCFTPAEQPADLTAETQQAVTEVTQAILHGDREAFVARFEADPNDPPGMVDKLLESQKPALLSHYGETAPQIVDLREEPNGVSVTLFATEFNAVSPKRVYFRRDAAGVLRWRGIVRAEEAHSANQLRQAIFNCFEPGGGEKCEQFDIWNQEATQTHAIRGQSQMLNVPYGCDSSSFCWNTNQLPWYKTILAGFYGSAGMACTQSGTQCAINLVSPTYSNCTCAGSVVTRASGYCAWINAWGWDFWWPNQGWSINSLPQIGAPASCP